MFGVEEFWGFGVEGFWGPNSRTLLLNLGLERATGAPPQWRDPRTRSPRKCRGGRGRGGRRGGQLTTNQLIHLPRTPLLPIRPPPPKPRSPPPPPWSQSAKNPKLAKVEIGQSGSRPSLHMSRLLGKCANDSSPFSSSFLPLALHAVVLPSPVSCRAPLLAAFPQRQRGSQLSAVTPRFLSCWCSSLSFAVPQFCCGSDPSATFPARVSSSSLPFQPVSYSQFVTLSVLPWSDAVSEQQVVSGRVFFLFPAS